MPIDVNEATKAINAVTGSNRKDKAILVYVVLGIFLGIQYGEFRTKLQRIEDKLSKVEQLETRIAALEKK